MDSAVSTALSRQEEATANTQQDNEVVPSSDMTSSAAIGPLQSRMRGNQPRPRINENGSYVDCLTFLTQGRFWADGRPPVNVWEAAQTQDGVWQVFGKEQTGQTASVIYEYSEPSNLARGVWTLIKTAHEDC